MRQETIQELNLVVFLAGDEVNSLVLAVYNVGSEGQPLEASLQKNILALPKRKIEIFVSLTCHFCPDVAGRLPTDCIN